MIAAEFRHVTKRYRHTVALDDLSLSIPVGSVFGLVGPNGAGKTTAVKILLGLTRASGGTVSMFGGDRDRRVSYLPDVPAQYGWMTAREYLRFIGGINGIPENIQKPRIDSLLEMAGLASAVTPIGGYSRGMRQRLGIAQALVTAPDLLILDEPTSALDPLGRRDVLNLMEELRGKTTIIFSSHILDDVERVADQFAILNRGKLVANGTLDDIRADINLTPHLEIDVLGDADAFAADVRAAAWYRDVTIEGNALQIHTSDRDAAMRDLPRFAADLDCGIARLDYVSPSLEDAFVALTGGER